MKLGSAWHQQELPMKPGPEHAWGELQAEVSCLFCQTDVQGVHGISDAVALLYLLTSAAGLQGHLMHLPEFCAEGSVHEPSEGWRGMSRVKWGRDQGL